MLNLFDYDFGVRLIKPDPNIYYRTVISHICNTAASYEAAVLLYRRGDSRIARLCFLS